LQEGEEQREVGIDFTDLWANGIGLSQPFMVQYFFLLKVLCKECNCQMAQPRYMIKPDSPSIEKKSQDLPDTQFI